MKYRVQVQRSDVRGALDPHIVDAYGIEEARRIVEPRLAAGDTIVDVVLDGSDGAAVAIIIPRTGTNVHWMVMAAPEIEAIIRWWNTPGAAEPMTIPGFPRLYKRNIRAIARPV